jgi:hypothetical protein
MWKIAVVSVILSGASLAQVTQRVSVDSSGGQGNNESGQLGTAISADGRFVVFASNASNLVPGDTNESWDIFVRDRQSGTTERVSVDSAGVEGNNTSQYPSISDDGRYVAFESMATNLVPGDMGVFADIFVRDRLTGVTERVSVDSGGVQGDSDSHNPSISADGRYVAFWSYATNLVPGDTNGYFDVFVHDRQSGATELVSVDSVGLQGNIGSYWPAISADGRYVAFMSNATNLVIGGTNGVWHIFVHDRQTGATELVSVDSGGIQANGNCYYSSISVDGRYVAFESLATNLVPEGTNGSQHIYVRDRQSGTLELVSVDSGGVQADNNSAYPSLSADGRFVAFWSQADNLVPGDTNQFGDTFVRDRQSGTTERVSISSSGIEESGDSWLPTISADGRYVSADCRYVAFASWANNLVPGDTNMEDVFVRDRLGGTSFTSLCDPGVGVVIGCPCSNAPSGAGRGCDNSASTGGAILSASGGTYLSSDSLTFTTSGEIPTAMSVLLQGTAVLPSGEVFGRGVRCAGGVIRKLFVKTASGGSITVPDFGGGDPSVSTRSASQGDVIQPGQSRWYLVRYRDPNAACPASFSAIPVHTSNATQTGQVSWSP